MPSDETLWEVHRTERHTGTSHDSASDAFILNNIRESWRQIYQERVRNGKFEADRYASSDNLHRQSNSAFLTAFRDLAKQLDGPRIFAVTQHDQWLRAASSRLADDLRRRQAGEHVQPPSRTKLLNLNRGELFLLMA